MLTFKKTLHDANVAFEKAAADREHTIETLLTLFKLDYGQSRKQRLTYAISKLSAANDCLTKAGDELLRLKHIEHVTDLIVSPFPAHIAEQMRAAGIDEEAQREIANEMLADETPASKPPRSWREDDWDIHKPEPHPDDARHCAICGGPIDEPADDAALRARWRRGDLKLGKGEWMEGAHLFEPCEMPDASWLHERAAKRREEWRKADIGAGFVEYRPGTIAELLDSQLSDIERSMTNAECGTQAHKAIEAVIDMLLGDEPLSLHGDGHVGPVIIGPVEQHLRDCAARETNGFSLHDLLEAISEPMESLVLHLLPGEFVRAYEAGDIKLENNEGWSQNPHYRVIVLDEMPRSKT
jgi:hypothetical protein